MYLFDVLKFRIEVTEFGSMSLKNPNNQDDERYESEEYLVYVDLDTKLLDDQLSNSNAKIKFLGIDTETPIMQLNNQVFKGFVHKCICPKFNLFILIVSFNSDFSYKFNSIGSYEYSMGTNCFFTESRRAGGVEDACFQELPKKLYDFFAKTNKVLKMKRIFVEEKETATTSELAEGEIEDLEHLRISKTYEEALNQFLKLGEKPPREIVHSYESSEEPQNEEDNVITKAVMEVKAEEIANTDFECLTDPDYEPLQSS